MKERKSMLKDKNMEVVNGLISIIVPVFNVRKYLDKCLESIVHQTYSQIEIIIIDDESTDGSGELCDSWKQKDERIQVFHKKNGGLSSARNMGLEKAKGEFIGFIDSDDYVNTDMYEDLLNFMEDDVDIVSCGTVLEYPKQINADSQILYLPENKKKCKKYIGNSSVEELLLARSFSFSACDKIFRRWLFEGIRFPVGRSSEDLPVIFHIFLKCRNIVNIGKVKYHYVYRNNSISRQDFFYRRIDYVIFSGKICKEVEIYFPQYKKQAEAYYMRCLSFMISKIKESDNKNEFSDLEKRLQSAFVKLFIRNIFNKYIKIKEKKQLLEKSFRSN